MEKLDDKKHVEEFLTMETWLNDNVPVAGEVFREFVKYLYQQNLLVQNRLKIGRRTVNLKQITCPVLNLMAEYDDLVPAVTKRAVLTIWSARRDCEAIKLPAGHIGLAMGSTAQRELWPHVQVAGETLVKPRFSADGNSCILTGSPLQYGYGDRRAIIDRG